MLQQTTVAAVMPYYERFLSRFPSVRALAAAKEDDVLRAWEGLGYYSRARNLLRTARRLIDEHAGVFPGDVQDLMALPGIGRYTAGAIASFAFDVPAPIVEANTLRLYCRLLGYDSDPRSAHGQRLLWSFAAQLVPSRGPGDFNQALMDLGATLCTPLDPDCPACPLKSGCRSLSTGRVDEIPVSAPRKAITEVTEASVAVRRRDTYLLRRRGNDERWAGLWDFLRFQLSPARKGDGPAESELRDLVERVRAASGLKIHTPAHLQTLRHSVTRYRITLHCLTGDVYGGRLRSSNTTIRWVKPSQFANYPLSVTGRKFARLLTEASAGPSSGMHH